MIQRAIVKDARAIHQLINHYGSTGKMLTRSLNEIFENIRDFIVFKEDDEVIGVSSLHIDWEDLAEIRSLAVKEDCHKKGIGSALVKASISEAEEMGIKKLFALTYVPDFFLKFGFKVTDKSEFPHKIWGDCVKCPKFPECDEIALIYEIRSNNK